MNYIASWDELIKAFRIIHLNNVTNDIEQLLIQGEHGMLLIYLDMIYITCVVVMVCGADDNVMYNN